MKTTQIYQVGELVLQIRRLMEASYPEVWVEGEISSFTRATSGHLYFSLKDQNAILRCAMFKNRAGINRYKPKNGDLVKARVKISVYTARGDLQCIVQHLEEAGEGVLQRRYEELKNKLNEEGLFSVTHKQRLPKTVAHIGVVTSPSGAVIQDILSTLKRRNPAIKITIYPARVQGEGAAESVRNALKTAHAHGQCDAIIVARGGGSMEDLWSFNDESLARDIFDSTLPIVSAIGHEVDFTIADLVADIRAPTPTAAAELISIDRASLLRRLDELGASMVASTARNLQQKSQTVDFCFKRLSHPSTKLAAQRQQLSGISAKLCSLWSQKSSKNQNTLAFLNHRFINNHAGKAINDLYTQCNSLHRSLQKSILLTLNQKQASHTSKAEQLQMVSPLATLARGFSIARKNTGEIIRSSSSVVAGELIGIELKNGHLNCQVREIEKE